MSTIVDAFVEWSGSNHLLLNVKKTREVVLGRRQLHRHTSTVPGRQHGQQNEMEDQRRAWG